ncbi:uncharacterized protein LOC143121398 [Alosa pseudoharengus]|uniref:uncharacterized protein LOC143121398 n=1 Tax=Alosa pseudoharengus TaxID=34774 RepID=UPI003F888138
MGVAEGFVESEVVLVQPNISLSAPDGGLFWGPQGPEETRGHSLSLICSTEPQHQGGHCVQQHLQVNTDSTTTVIVRVVLVQPNISLSAPDGGLFWGPQGPEVTRGHSLSLICSTEPQHQGGSFHLIFDGSNRTRTQLAVDHSASFYIPEADYSHQGSYSCVYEVTVSSRTFKSTQTALLTVIVRASPAPIIASGVISGLFLLLLIPVIFYLVKKKCFSHSSANSYGHGQGGSPDEDENIYMNAVMSADQRDHDKEADGDLEEDYVNVEELCRPTAVENDYEEDDIYQNYN